MKIRTRKYRDTLEKPSYWPSFVDVMTTITLVFFFIMIIISGMSKLMVDNIADKRLALYEKIQSNLNENNVSEDFMKLNKEEGKLEIPTETFFDSGKSDLKEDGINAADTLGRIFMSLFNDEEIESQIQYIEIVGHTDYVGDTIYNRTLSTERAMSFLNRMVPMDSELENKLGHKFKASGMSEFEKIDENNRTVNSTAEERYGSEYNEEEAQKLRRIEVRMVFSNTDIENSIKDEYN